MEEDKILTAEEFIKDMYSISNVDPEGWWDPKDMKHCMIEFAKMHVKAKENALIKKCSTYGNGWDDSTKEDIINTYPLSNIK